MKTYKYLNISILALFLVLVLNSCQDFFIKELDVPRQDLDNQLVVHAFISDIDSTIEFKIAKNFGLDAVFEEAESLINGATISLFKGGDELYNIEQNADTSYRIDLEQNFGYSDENFRIEVLHPDYEKAVIETYMPEFVMPESLVFTKNGGFANPNGSESLDLLQITIDDPADEENYYELQIHQVIIDSEEIIFGEDTFVIETRYPDNYFSPDGNLDQGISGLLISDQIFNGQKYNIQIMLNRYEESEEIPVEKLRVSWNCISKDHFDYSKSLLQYQRSSGFGLFSDPIAVYSNVENGLGVVSLRSTRILPVEEN